MEKKKSGVTKRTWEKKAKTFAARGMILWDDMNRFADDACKSMSPRKKERFIDRLTTIVDGYVKYNCEILTWCHKNGVDPMDFVCDVTNGFSNL